MSKELRSLLAAAALMVFAIATAGESFAAQPPTSPPPGVPRGTGPIIYVPDHGLAYESIALGTLPFQGSFQELMAGGPTGLMTEFGLGDEGYVGGRWWLDSSEPFGVMNEGDTFFLCPLLGPGYEVE